MIKYLIMVGYGRFTVSEMHNGIEVTHDRYGDSSYLKIQDGTVHIYQGDDCEAISKYSIDQCIITTL
jgi:hypothetical protein